MLWINWLLRHRTTMAVGKISCLPVPGSQFAIEIIPQMLPKGIVAVPGWGYTEHAYCWQKAGHQLVWYQTISQLLQLVDCHLLIAAVVINPNNPTAELIPPAELLKLQQRLSARQGVLVVDEAFMDCTPEYSLCRQFGEGKEIEGLIVLRSLGKFFGLAWLRLGFLIAEKCWLSRAEAPLSPWAVSHPARWLGRRALEDREWQQLQQQRLLFHSRQWRERLEASFPELQWHSTALFATGFGRYDICYDIHQSLAREGVFVRLIAPTKNILEGDQDNSAAIRLGLPGEEQGECVSRKITRVAEAVATV